MKRKEQTPNVPPAFKNRISDLNVSDELNPELIFQMTDASLLVDIVKEQINIKQMARDELARRGLSQNSGNWIGIDKAREQAKTLLYDSIRRKWVSIPERD